MSTPIPTKAQLEWLQRIANGRWYSPNGTSLMSDRVCEKHGWTVSEIRPGDHRYSKITDAGLAVLRSIVEK